MGENSIVVFEGYLMPTTMPIPSTKEGFRVALGLGTYEGGGLLGAI